MKLFHVIVVFFLLTGFAACKQGQEQPPIPEERMQQILVDMHLAETYSLGLGDSTNRFEKNYDSLAGFYTSILKHHSLSFEEFNEALTWYKQRPLRIDTLYGKVLNQLTELKASAGLTDIEENKYIAAPPNQADTIKPRSWDSVSAKPVLPVKPGFNKPDTTRKDKVSKPVTQSEP